ncbi:MAG: hypothetical protein IK084_01245, partial [Bacteroidaceae bacterium]|nr:hypothetical protein [Bacteroidaceae bacterium]
TRISRWQGGPIRGGQIDVSGSNYNAEKFDCNYNIYQTLTDIPNGVYTIKAQGFYREGADANYQIGPAIDLRRGGNEHLYAKFYANYVETPVMSIFDEAGKRGEVGISSDWGYVPNNPTEASDYFSAGLYDHDMGVVVTDGVMRIGVYKGTAVYRDWTCFDNFRLYYCDWDKADLTVLVGTTRTDWNATSMVDWATPDVTTRDGRETPLAERYENTADNAGTMLYQPVRGLPNGTYTVVLYANAMFTAGRGFYSDITDGQTDVVYLFANDTKQYIPANIGTSVYANGEYTLTANVTDGTLYLGMVAEKAGTNWHTMQIKSLDYVGSVIDGIDEINDNGNASLNTNEIYDLSGRKVNGNDNGNLNNLRLRKGIYIVNGKKVMIK